MNLVPYGSFLERHPSYVNLGTVEKLYENGHVITDPSKRAGTDTSVKGMKEKGREAEKKKDKIIQDTYKTLLSRAMKGVVISTARIKLLPNI